MNNLFKNILIFSVGAGLGAFITYRFLKEEYEDLVQEEIESIREVSERRKNKDDNFSYEASVAIDLATENVERKNNIIYRKLSDDYTPYNKVGSKEGINMSVSESEPCVISVEAFHEGKPYYDKITLFYYENDDTLSTEEEEILSNVEEIVGEALLSFGEQSGDPDIVYVRNERLSIDYEIIRLMKSYQETVLGFEEEEPPKRRRSNEKE